MERHRRDVRPVAPASYCGRTITNESANGLPTRTASPSADERHQTWSVPPSTKHLAADERLLTNRPTATHTYCFPSGHTNIIAMEFALVAQASYGRRKAGSESQLPPAPPTVSCRASSPWSSCSLRKHLMADETPPANPNHLPHRLLFPVGRHRHGVRAPRASILWHTKRHQRIPTASRTADCSLSDVIAMEFALVA